MHEHGEKVQSNLSRELIYEMLSYQARFDKMHRHIKAITSSFHERAEWDLSYGTNLPCEYYRT